MKDLPPHFGTKKNIRFQWRIQDFPDGGTTNPQGGGASQLFDQMFSHGLHERERNCTLGRVPGTHLDLPRDFFLYKILIFEKCHFMLCRENIVVGLLLWQKNIEGCGHWWKCFLGTAMVEKC